MVSRQMRAKLMVWHSVEEHTSGKVSENHSEAWMGVSPIHMCVPYILLADYPKI